MYRCPGMCRACAHRVQSMAFQCKQFAYNSPTPPSVNGVGDRRTILNEIQRKPMQNETNLKRAEWGVRAIVRGQISIARDVNECVWKVESKCFFANSRSYDFNFTCAHGSQGTDFGRAFDLLLLILLFNCAPACRLVITFLLHFNSTVLTSLGRLCIGDFVVKFTCEMIHSSSSASFRNVRQPNVTGRMGEIVLNLNLMIVITTNSQNELLLPVAAAVWRNCGEMAIELNHFAIAFLSIHS